LRSRTIHFLSMTLRIISPRVAISVASPAARFDKMGDQRIVAPDAVHQLARSA
jgi:hypothetical protein